MRADTFNEKLVLLKKIAKDFGIELGVTMVNIRLKAIEEKEIKQIVATDDIEWFVISVITAPATLANDKIIIDKK